MLGARQGPGPQGTLGWTNLLLAAALLWFVLIGGSLAGDSITLIRTINAGIGGVLVGLWVFRVSRRADLVDLLALAALLCFLTACVLSTSPRTSFDPACAAVAYVAAFSLARHALIRPEARRAVLDILAASGLAFGMLFAAVWGERWISWISTAHEMPPLGLYLPVGPYRQFHVIGLLAALLLPACIRWIQGRRTRLTGLLGTGALAAVAVMSESRTVWLAVVVGIPLGVLVASPTLLRRIPRWAGPAVLAAGLLATVTGLLGPLLTRLGVTSTIALRLTIWTSSFQDFLHHPLAGTGPGTFPAALTAGGYFNRYLDAGRHADSAVVQLLGEAGIAGLLTFGLLVAAVATGVLMRRRASWIAAAGLLVFVLCSFTDNPTDTTQLVVVLIAWAALATAPIEARQPRAVPRWWYAAPAVGSAVAGTAMVATLLGAGAYDQAGAAARDGQPAAVVVQNLRAAEAFDPAMSLYHRDLGVWLVAAGDAGGGIEELRRAVRLQPADATAIRSLALAHARSGDALSAVDVARAAVSIRGAHEENQLTLAWVAIQAGETAVADDALTEAVRTHPWITATPEWAADFPSYADPNGVLQEAQTRWLAAREGEPRFAQAQTWVASAIGGAVSIAAAISPATEAQGSIIACRLDDASDQVTAMSRSERSSVLGLTSRILLARLTQDEDLDTLATLAQILYPPFGRQATNGTAAASPYADSAEDALLYGRIPVPPPDLGLRFPTSAEGMSIWLHNPLQAARVGAPSSQLAACR